MPTFESRTNMRLPRNGSSSPGRREAARWERQPAQPGRREGSGRVRDDSRRAGRKQCAESAHCSTCSCSRLHSYVANPGSDTRLAIRASTSVDRCEVPAAAGAAQISANQPGPPSCLARSSRTTSPAPSLKSTRTAPGDRDARTVRTSSPDLNCLFDRRQRFRRLRHKPR